MQTIDGKDMPNVALTYAKKKLSSEPVHLAYHHTALIKTNLWGWWVCY
jgi:hypothetical protein